MSMNSYERLEHGAEPDLVLLDLNLPGASGFSAFGIRTSTIPSDSNHCCIST